MNPYFLLILLTSWSLLVTNSEECDTGVAFTNSVLSIQRSSLANADVALLESYNAKSVERCMEECCSGKYGKCSIASFKKNTTEHNCLHFYCRPLKQCKFLSSDSTDSFTFSSNPYAPHPVPSSNASTTTSTYTSSDMLTTPKAKAQYEQPQAMEEIATFSEEQVDMKNDNTTIKPRKGVPALKPDAILSTSGIKARKGVTLEDIPHSKYLLNGLNKSNVKPRKGVEPYSSNQTSEDKPEPITSENNDTKNNAYNVSANDLISVLAEVFKDDPLAANTESIEVTTSVIHTILPTSSTKFLATSTVEHPTIETLYSFSTSSTPFIASNQENPGVSSTPRLRTSFSMSSMAVVATPIAILGSELTPLATSIVATVPLLSAKAHLSMEEPKSLNKTLTKDSEDTENNRKYTSSIHLVLSLVFGLLVLFAVLGVVAKRMYDGYQRRDYYRMNYLIDGIYNGYE